MSENVTNKLRNARLRLHMSRRLQRRELPLGDDEETSKAAEFVGWEREKGTGQDQLEGVRERPA